MLTGRTDHPVTDADAELCRALDECYAGGNELTKTRGRHTFSSSMVTEFRMRSLYIVKPAATDSLGWACFELKVVVTDETSSDFVSSQTNATEPGKGLWWSIGRPPGELIP